MADKFDVEHFVDVDKVCDVARFATWQTRKRLLAARRRAPDVDVIDVD
jgi:hypothetical protein